MNTDKQATKQVVDILESIPRYGVPDVRDATDFRGHGRTAIGGPIERRKAVQHAPDCDGHPCEGCGEA